jgi:hypothetical protein
VNYDYVLTGGQDGVVRLWKVTVDDEDDDENPKYTITKVKDLGKHAGAVMSLTFFNDAEMQCAVSSSRDGMIKIWDVSAAKLMADVPFMSDGLSGSGSKASTSAMQCRGAVLARNLDSDGALSLYSIQSGTRGPAHLIRWKVEQNAKDGGDSSPQSFDLKVIPAQAVYVTKTPATRLTISSDGLFIAVGCSDGTVHIYRVATTLSKYSHFMCHDLPVTGLAFAPSTVAAKAGAVAMITSGSADNRFAVMPIGGYSVWFTNVTRVLFFLIIVFLCLAAAAIFYHVGPLEQFVPPLKFA